MLKYFNASCLQQAALPCHGAASSYSAICAGDATPQLRINAGTLVATARALNAGCQPIHFAQWAETSTSNVAEGSTSRGQSSAAPSHDRHEQNGSSSQQEKSKQRPKVCSLYPFLVVLSRSRPSCLTKPMATSQLQGSVKGIEPEL